MIDNQKGFALVIIALNNIKQKFFAKPLWQRMVLIIVFFLIASFSTLFLIKMLTLDKIEQQGNEEAQQKKEQIVQNENSQKNKIQNEGKDYLSNPVVTNQLPSCQGNQLLSASPVDLNEIPSIYPLGNLNPAGHIYPSDHMGIGLVRENIPGNNVSNLKTNIKAPGDVHIFGIRKTTYKTNGVVTNEDYAMAMAPCKEVTIYFGHINSLPDNLQKKLDSVQKDCPITGQKEGDEEFLSCEYHLDYTAKSGEIIATAGGNNPGLPDFGSFDSRSLLAFINPGLYTYGTLHATCPIDYYSEPLKSALYAKLIRKVEPRCGKVMQDKLGTIQGDWYTKQSSEGSWANQLGVLHDNVDPAIGVVVVGGTVSNPGTVEYNPKYTGTVNREPSEVTADGKIYCYTSDKSSRNSNTLLSGHVLLQLLDNLTMKVEYQERDCNLNVSFITPTIYER